MDHHSAVDHDLGTVGHGHLFIHRHHLAVPHHHDPTILHHNMIPAHVVHVMHLIHVLSPPFCIKNKGWGCVL
jgi:hypothetical protein